MPAGVLERPLVQRLAALLPVALLAALTAQQTFADGHDLVLDARAAGLAAAAVALLLRAPFLLVVAAAVLVTAGVRATGLADAWTGHVGARVPARHACGADLVPPALRRTVSR